MMESSKNPEVVLEGGAFHGKVRYCCHLENEGCRSRRLTLARRNKHL